MLLSDTFIQTVLDGDVCFSPNFSCRQNTNHVSRQLIALRKERPAFEKKMLDFIPLKPANELRDEAEVLLYLQSHHGRVDYDGLEALLYYTRDYLNRIVKRRSSSPDLHESSFSSLSTPTPPLSS